MEAHGQACHRLLRGLRAVHGQDWLMAFIMKEREIAIQEVAEELGLR